MNKHINKKGAYDSWQIILNLAVNGSFSQRIKNPAIAFREAVLRGEYKDMSERERSEMLKGCEQLTHEILDDRPAAPVASMLTYKTMEGLPSVTLFMEPTGSGKTEIFRNLRHEFGTDNIIVCDATSLTVEGWKGDIKISTILKGLPTGQKNRAVIVFDEFDKLLEPQFDGNGTNYSDMLQNEFLRLCDHDKLYFGGDTGAVIDAANISVVFLGTFEKLMQKKSRESGSLGFGSTLRRNCDYGNTEITVEDLIDYGMRAELAGRIQKIVCLEPLNTQTMTDIGQREVRRLTKQMRRDVVIDDGALNGLACAAIEKKLGARRFKSQISGMLDNLIYENLASETYFIGFNEPCCYEDVIEDDELAL